MDFTSITAGIITDIALGVLALLLGWVVWQIGRILVSVFQAYRWKRSLPPPRKLQHPKFGELAFDGMSWSGSALIGGRTIEFEIAGSEGGPSPALEGPLSEVIVRGSDFERAALAFIRSQEPSLPHEQLGFESIEFLSESAPGMFTMRFMTSDTPDGWWEVEFEDGCPKSVGYIH